MSSELPFGLVVVFASLVLMVALVLLSFRTIETIHRRKTAEGSEAQPQNGGEKKHGRRR